MSRNRPHRPDQTRADYFAESMRPLAILLFLLPLIILYEIASAYFLADEQGQLRETIAAYALLAKFFEVFGAFGLLLPGLALVVVLLLQHILARNAWRTRPAILPMMLLESCVLATPLLVLALVFGPQTPAAIVPPGVELAAWPWQARLTIAVGAGLYEELLFRMVAIMAIHTLAVDLLGAKDGLGKLLGVVLSAAAFAFYHDLTDGSGRFVPQRLAFFFAAGLYFGMLYLGRGFGLAVGAHIAYDALALLLLTPETE